MMMMLFPACARSEHPQQPRERAALVPHGGAPAGRGARGGRRAAGGHRAALRRQEVPRPRVKEGNPSPPHYTCTSSPVTCIYLHTLQTWTHVVVEHNLFYNFHQCPRDLFRSS